MRILMITTSTHRGGAARYVVENARALIAQGHEVEAVVAEAGLNDLKYRICKPLSVERWMGVLEILPGIFDERHFAFRRAIQSLSIPAYDLIHINQISGGWCSFKSLHALTQRLPVVWTHHDQWAATNGIACDLTSIVSKKDAIQGSSKWNRLLRLSPHHPSVKSRSLGAILKSHPPRVDVHICPSRHLASMLSANELYQDADIHVIRNATLLGEVSSSRADRNECRQLLGLPVDRPILLFVSANLSDIHKGLHFLAPSLARLKSQGMDPLLQLLGRADASFDPSRLGIDCRLNVANDENELAVHYHAADLTLIPSLVDNFPYVAIESLSCGTPYVAFATSGPEEIGIEFANGLARNFLASNFDRDSFVDLVQKLVGSPSLRARLGALGKDWVEQECRYTRTLPALLNAYDSAREAFNRAAQIPSRIAS